MRDSEIFLAILLKCGRGNQSKVEDGRRAEAERKGVFQNAAIALIG
jgi:hypothetical protein